MLTTTAVPGRRLAARHYLAYAGVCLLLGSNWPAVRVLVRTVPPLRAAAMQYALAAALTAVVALVRRSRIPRRRSDWSTMVVMAVTMLAIPTSFVAWGEQYVTASLTAVMWAAFPIFVALLTPLMGRGRVPGRAFVGVIVAAFGVAVLFWDGVPPGAIGRLAAGAVLFAVFVCAWGVLWASHRPALLVSAASLAIQFAIAATVAFAGSTAFEHGHAAVWTREAIGAYLFLATGGTALIISLYYWLLKEIAPFQVATLDLIVPVVAFTEGALILREPVTPIMVGAALVVILATAYVLRIQYAR